VTIPPDAPGTIAVLANEPIMLLLLLPIPPPVLLPQAPKSLDGCALVITGLLMLLMAGAGTGAGAAGAGSAQALLPHTSAPENPPPPPPMVPSGLAVVVAAGTGGDLGCVRLKTDELDADGAARAGAGAAAGAGDEKSKRSFIADDAGAAGFGWDAAGEEKSPKPPKPPKPLLDGAGLLAGACAAAAGLESKKPPPLRPENAEDDDG
jgi:hypothetical protein